MHTYAYPPVYTLCSGIYHLIVFIHPEVIAFNEIIDLSKDSYHLFLALQKLDPCFI